MARLIGSAACVAVLAAAGCGVTEPNAGRYPPPAPSVGESGRLDAARVAIAAAVADPARPATDRDRDARVQPAALLAFARAAPGQRGAVVRGDGYYGRLLERVAGPQGRVSDELAPDARLDLVLAESRATAAAEPDPTHAEAFAALAPGGLYVLTDAVDDARAAVEAAGFVFDAERRGADGSLALRFRKPLPR